MVGEAVTYDGSEVDALIAFLGDDMLVNFDGQLYRKTAEGQLHPVEKPRARVVVVKPPAGEWFMISDVELKQEYAIHVSVPQGVQGPTAKPAAKKAAPTKATAKPKKK